METRFEEVSEEHSKTFEWIFGDTTQDNNPDCDGPSQESFVHWLSAGRDIFHICGKLGSGKSTLMKFLCNHDRTETELQRWAGGRKLIRAKFFFWRGATTKEQKSLTGLVRSLLYETLRACPELIPDTLPGLWAQLESLSWQVDMRLDLSKLQIRAAISNLITHRDLYKEHCFCFFIDGLDEFEKTHEDGYGDLIRLLKSWSDAAPDAVKICVSSREDLVFMDAFSTKRRFRLQDLTREDIQRYVRDKLPLGADEKGEDLVEKITERADGIFLWVALVVKSIRDQLDEGYDLSDVEQELDRLPRELHELFECLLKSISISGRKRAHRTFAMVLKLRHYKINMSLLAYSFLGEYEKEPAFAMEESFPFSNMDDDTRRSREDLARKRLYRDCRRLLEVKQDPARKRMPWDPQPPLGLKQDETIITITHRSILEFLESQPVKDEMRCILDGFSTEDAVSQLSLAELRCERGKISPRFLSLVVYNLLKMRHQSNVDQEPYHFQEALSSIVSHHSGTDLETQMKDFPWIATAWSEACPGAGIVNGSIKSKSPENFLASPLYVSAFYGACEYVIWKIERDPAIIEHTSNKGAIVCYAESGLCFSENHHKQLKLLELLLIRGLSPNTVIHTHAGNSNFEGELSFWQHFILFTVIVFDPWSNKEKKDVGELVEKFLEHDADPHLWILLLPRPPTDDWADEPDFVFRVTLARERCKTIEVMFFRHYRPKHQCPLPVEEGEEVSLRQILEFWAFDNGEAILQLLDRNVQRRELLATVANEAHQVLLFVLGILLALVLPRLWAMVTTELSSPAG
ncbi:hypothetical protein, variant [Cladophialophora immunda]|nr:hypothetical protein, variant [Cladophialophora immunda]KIW32805.1 hypothetical protein, variant [Cladophialophora immunda]